MLTVVSNQSGDEATKFVDYKVSGTELVQINWNQLGIMWPLGLFDINITFTYKRQKKTNDFDTQ